ncbi:MAG: YbaB/EbfC family nucleoid-associated protein [Planctomycetes bacterium]|nr:YbaB/EbfC family nucleoid-associated protein [Planctomycetota bacterium]
MGDMWKQFSRIRKDMDRVQEELKDRYVEASVGGRVEVVFNGQQELVKLSIDPKAIEPDRDGKVDLEMLEDLVTAAVNQGIEKSKALQSEEMDKATGGLASGLPGLL